MYQSKGSIGNWTCIGRGISKAGFTHPDLPGYLVKIPIREEAFRADTESDVRTHYNRVQQIRKMSDFFDFKHIILPKTVLFESPNGPYVVEEKFDLMPKEEVSQLKFIEDINREFERFLKITRLCDISLRNHHNAGFLNGTQNDPKIGVFDVDCRK